MLMCSGMATACDTYADDVACSDQGGCFVSGACVEPGTGFGGAGGTGGGGGMGGGGGNIGCGMYTDKATCETMGCDWLMPCLPTVDCVNDPQLNNDVTCNQQQGCEWDVNNNECIVKLVNGCVDELVEMDCGLLMGCAWDQDYFSCGGTADDCSTFNTTNCADQDGCMVQ
jgi:hypothetical protein